MSARYKTLSMYSVLAALAGLFLVGSASFAAAGHGHYYIASAMVGKLLNDPNAPAALRDALKDPSCADAFCNGAVAPDLGSLTLQAHNGDKTTSMPRNLIATAQGDLARANALPTDDSDKPAKIKQAQQELAFSYGWLSHCAADLATHPVVNAQIGDSFAHGNLEDNMNHGFQEVELTHYIDKNYRIDKSDTFDFHVPFEFLSGCTGIPVEELQWAALDLNKKMYVEYVKKNDCDIPNDKLAEKWRKAIQESMSDTIKFIEDPGKFLSWDIDIGRMTTEEFETLRTAAIEAYGGKLPPNWGKKYLEWYDKTKGLKGEELQEALVTLVRTVDEDQVTEDAVPGKINVRLSSANKMKVFVNGFELPVGEAYTVGDSDKTLSFKAVMDTDVRKECDNPVLDPNDPAKITEHTPYRMVAITNLKDWYEERKTEVENEIYKWSPPSDQPGKASSSGVYPKVKNDVFDWTLPKLRSQGGDVMDMTCTIGISGQIDWVGTIANNDVNDTYRASENGSATVTVILAQ